ncbi:hypothetical protein CALCODRAFT_544160 [Calocera cornea HHB12733]|uniref:Uncharacterized protein n=1 Tax=Calocera cornea HHB12733 TaxID=1353952 RepID=A0A165F6N8_9BASI|nr:hypothetical protein CALCODRAFT_544160 [Calocera cornea HHB12733]
MAENVQPGACADLMQGFDNDVDFYFQIVKADRAAVRGQVLKSEEYRLTLSDCEWTINVMLDPRLNHILVEAGALGLLRVRKVTRAVIGTTSAYVVPWEGERVLLGEPVAMNQSTRAAVGAAGPTRPPPTGAMERLTVEPASGRESPSLLTRVTGAITNVGRAAGRAVNAGKASVAAPTATAATVSANTTVPPARNPLPPRAKQAVGLRRGPIAGAPPGRRTGWGQIGDAFDEDGNPLGEDDVEPVPLNTLDTTSAYYVVHVRVIEKNPRKEGRNTRGHGFLLPMIVQDQWRNKMKVVAFDDDVIRGIEAEIVVGSTIAIWGCKISEALVKTVGVHPFDMTLGKGRNAGFSHIADNGVIPFGQATYTPIDLLSGFVGQERVDVLATILSVSPLEHFKDDKGKPKNRRELAIGDESMRSMRVVIWSERAVSFAGKPGDIVLLLGVVVDSYGGGSLNVYRETGIELNPTTDKAGKLRRWYERLAEGAQFQSVSSGYSAGCQLPENILPRSVAISIKRLKKSDMGRGSRVDTFNIVEKIMEAEYDCTYRSCTFEGCNKKLDLNNRCPTGSHNPQRPGVHRYCFLLKLRVGQAADFYDITAFDGVVDKMLGMSANKAARPAYDRLKDEAIERLINQTWWFTVQTRTKEWNSGSIRTNSVKGAVRIDDGDGTVIPNSDYEADSDDDDHEVDPELDVDLED